MERIPLYLISAVPLYFCHLHRRESVYCQGDRRIFSHWRPWRCPQKNKLSKRQSDRSQVAYFRDLLIPLWQERVSDVLLASVLFGSGLVSLPSEERGGAWGWDQCDSGMRVQKKFFLFFFPLALQGHCYSSSYLKCSGTFLPWCLFFHFYTFECWKLTHATVWKLLFLQKSFKQVDCILQNAARHPLCCV